MNARFLYLSAVSLFAVVLLAGLSAEAKGDRESALARIRALGGKARSAVVSVYLEGTEVKDAAVKDVSELKDLQSLNLFKTGISDGALAHLDGMRQLTSLSISGPIGDEAFAHIGKLTRLRNLYCPSSVVSDAGTAHLKGLIQLESLTLGRSKITNETLPHLANMSQLRNLNLYDTVVSDGGLEHLRGLKNLRFIVLKRTNVTEAGVKRLQAALPECQVSWSPRT